MWIWKYKVLEIWKYINVHVAKYRFKKCRRVYDIYNIYIYIYIKNYKVSCNRNVNKET